MYDGDVKKFSHYSKEKSYKFAKNGNPCEFIEFGFYLPDEEYGKTSGYITVVWVDDYYDVGELGCILPEMVVNQHSWRVFPFMEKELNFLSVRNEDVNAYLAWDEDKEVINKHCITPFSLCSYLESLGYIEGTYSDYKSNATHY